MKFFFAKERASHEGHEAATSLATSCEARRRERVFFLSPHSFGTANCSFPGIGASKTNFHLVNQLVRYVPTFIVDISTEKNCLLLMSKTMWLFALIDGYRQ